MYYFIRWKHTEEGYVPELPDDVGFVMLAEPGPASEGAAFALFECYLPEEFARSDGINAVPNELAELLESAKDYPPALALARDELEPDGCRSEADFADKLTERLTYHLQSQRDAPFFMAKARSTDIGYKHAGGYYWIVGCESELVLWVSRDYYVYRDPVGDFELDGSDVETRFAGKECPAAPQRIRVPFRDSGV